MKTSSSKIKEEIFDELENLKEANLKEVLDFVCFLKVKKAIDPSQAYFWTKKWQSLEKEADADKKAGRVVGDGTVGGLLKALNKERAKAILN